jgi:5-formyltetrahydrofolate cyclo-ligase
VVSKTALRREMRRLLAAVPPESFRREGAAAAAFVTKLPLWAEAGALLIFISLKDEIDTAPLREAALREGKKVFVPRTEGETLAFYRIPGPPSPAPLGPGDFPALIMVPGLAFDRGGRRLGRGGGYYDRFLADLDRQGLAFSAVGLCTEAQILPEIPTDPWDRKMDGVCTGTALRQGEDT